MQWEYYTAVLTGGFMGRHKDELHRARFDQQLRELGQQGWELCWVLMEQALQGEKDGHVLIFKRPLGGSAAPPAPPPATAFVNPPLAPQAVPAPPPPPPPPR